MNDTSKKAGKKQKRMSRVDLQAFLLTAIMVVLSCVLIFLINYTLSYQDMIDSLQERARGIYRYLEQNLDEESFSQLNVPGDMKGGEYHAMKEMLEDTKSAASVRYLYTAKRTDTGEYIYLVDGLPAENEDFRNVGDPIEPEIIPDIERAYRNEVVLPEQIKDTSWGNIFISYFPIHTGIGEGEVIGVVGIEFDAEHQYRTFRWLSMATPAIIAICCVAAGIVAAFLFKRISNPAYRDLANTDLLTGLNNRNSFNVMLNNLEALPDKAGIGVLVIDLDNLKQVNDLLGHPAGDEYIRAGGSLVQEFIHSPNVLYRVGGDEFAAVMREATPEGLLKLVDEINEAAGDFHDQNGTRVGLSVGSAVFRPGEDKGVDDVVRRADEEMYRVKRMKKSGGNGER
ncbi:GGDEF domain-containing protein [Christensenella intestinihominis]|uniref:GGDEF domain-containing protein n=1 Tax=Christensenella intestinihominis TaxID=1851429 RepID=UPI00083029AE|nr:GGDEF domain-containing protein [Christensenella intestinihominis]